MRVALLFFLFLLPGSARAAIIVSEVAWMGSSASANHEWIELQNTSGSSVDVTGWIISDGMNFSVTLSGTIGGNQYAVLERTSDASAIGPAFFIYTGALVNTGATLRLNRADGALEDQVAGGDNWENIGGDNATKETAQYSSSGWVTGVGTPGATNSGIIKDDEDEEEENDDDQDEEGNVTPDKVSSKSSSSGDTVRLTVRDSTLVVGIDAQKIGYVNQEILFNAKPAGIGRTIESSLVYQWNFGDGSIGYGKEISHEFFYPGTYIVTLYSVYKKQRQISRHEITILPVAMTLTRSRLGDFQVNNDSPYEIDISGYTIEGNKSFVFPKYSILLPSQTVTLPTYKVGGSQVWIKDALGEIVTTGFSKLTTKNEDVNEEIPEKQEFLATTVISSQSDNVTPTLGVGRFGFADTAPALNVGPTPPLEAAVINAVATSSAPAKSNKAWPYIGLIIIMTLGLVGTAMKVTRNQTQ